MHKRDFGFDRTGSMVTNHRQYRPASDASVLIEPGPVRRKPLRQGFEQDGLRQRFLRVDVGNLDETSPESGCFAPVEPPWRCVPAAFRAAPFASVRPGVRRDQRSPVPQRRSAARATRGSGLCSVPKKNTFSLIHNDIHMTKRLMIFIRFQSNIRRAAEECDQFQEPFTCHVAVFSCINVLFHGFACKACRSQATAQVFDARRRG